MTWPESTFKAIDEAGPARMTAKLQPDKPGAICDVIPHFRRFEPDTTMPGRPHGHVLEGKALAPLDENDPRFADDRHYVHLTVNARVPEGESSSTPGNSTGTTIFWNVRDFANFVLPIPEELASTSTQTTLAASPGGLLNLEEEDLHSASVFVHSYGRVSGPDEYPIDLTDPGKRASLLALLNGLKKDD